MTFVKAQSKIPAAIGDISVVLIDCETAPLDADGNPQEDLRQQVRFEVQVKDANGEIIQMMTGNLVPHLTPVQITELRSFLNAIRTKAETEILQL